MPEQRRLKTLILLLKPSTGAAGQAAEEVVGDLIHPVLKRPEEGVEAG